MDIIKYALQMEKDGEIFYRKITEKTEHKSLKAIVTMLADEEVKHYKAIERMREDKYEIIDTDILDNARNIFEQMKDKAEEFSSQLGDVELYKKAQEMEKLSQQFYRDNAKKIDEAKQKDLFSRLAKEEKKHYFLLENIIEFISRPKLWLENAEWYHLEEY